MDNCGDSRFEIIEKAKQDLLNSTNIDSSKDEMRVLDNFLFRCWQMGWLKQYNLTSDVEGEEDELLTVQRSKVIDIFTQNTTLLSEGHLEYLSGYYNGKCHVLKDLFGSKVFAG